MWYTAIALHLKVSNHSTFMYMCFFHLWEETDLFNLFNFLIIKAWLIYNVSSSSVVQKSDPITHISLCYTLGSHCPSKKKKKKKKSLYEMELVFSGEGDLGILSPLEHFKGRTVGVPTVAQRVKNQT